MKMIILLTSIAIMLGAVTAHAQEKTAKIGNWGRLELSIRTDSAGKKTPIMHAWDYYVVNSIHFYLSVKELGEIKELLKKTYETVASAKPESKETKISVGRFENRNGSILFSVTVKTDGTKTANVFCIDSGGIDSVLFTITTQKSFFALGNLIDETLKELGEEQKGGK